MRRGSLRSSEDFERVLRRGRRARSDGVTVHVSDGGAGPARLGLAVRCSRAVDRNRLKRRVRASWREAAVRDGVDVVVKAGPDALRLSYQDLETHLIAALTRAGALR